MRKQWLFGWLAAMALLISLSVAACIQPIAAEAGQSREEAVDQATTDEATEEINKAAVYAWAEALSSGDLDEVDRAVDKYYAKDHVVHNPNLPEGTGGPEEIKRLVREGLTPNFHSTVEDVVAEGDMVAYRLTLTGHDPNDPEAELTVLNITRFVDGQFAEEWELP
jgi:predicted SnoaL-like aldol condensation-catalyzing enzyme